MSHRRRILFILFFIFSNNSNADSCADWFKQSKITPNSSDCISECTIYPVDMSTFGCHGDCEILCKKKKCNIDSFWKNKIKNGRPDGWDYKTEKTKKWSDSEIKVLQETLSLLPSEFKKLKLGGFYRMDKSVQIINPATTSDQKSIVLYDHTFSHSLYKTAQVITHELAHAMYIELSEKDKESYRNSLRWKVRNGGFHRDGTFLNQDSESSPEEDFAVNLENFLHQNAKIKAQLPNAYNWFLKKFSRTFRLKEDCNEL